MGYFSGEKMYYFGGSYGGYLGFEFLQRCPGVFKKYCIINPVVNWLNQMYHSDIPDWYKATAFKSDYDAFDIGEDYSFEEIKKMIDCSPGLREFDVDKLSGSKVLMFIGDSDKRVPPNASYYLYQKLRKIGVDVELRVYPGEGHAINNELKHMFDMRLTTLQEFLSEN